MSEDLEFSFARHALTVLGSAAAVLAVATVLVLVLHPGPGVGLLIVGVGIIAAVAVMASMSRRAVRRAFGEPSEADDPPE